MKCHNCGNNVSLKSEFCMHCGIKLKNDNPNSCSKCGKALTKNANFCTYCGGKVKREIKINYCHNCGADMKEAIKSIEDINPSRKNTLSLVIKIVFILLIIEVAFFFGWYLLF